MCLIVAAVAVSIIPLTAVRQTHNCRCVTRRRSRRCRCRCRRCRCRRRLSKHMCASCRLTSHSVCNINPTLYRELAPPLAPFRYGFYANAKSLCHIMCQ